MSEARFLVGDVFERMADIPDGSVDLAATSPPFWKQRAYLPADHPDKAREIGQEPTPADFIDTMLRLAGELRRVLTPHGSIAVELGDTSAGSGGAGGDYDPDGFRAGQPKWNGSAKRSGRPGDITTRGTHKHGRRTEPTGNDWGPLPDMHKGGNPSPGPAGPLNKSLCMIPEAYRLALAYGINPLTGEPSPAGRWIVRNVVDWCRPNPTPGDDGDKFRRATSDIAIATLNPKRWWDGEAVREPATGDRCARATNGRKAGAGDRDEVRSAGITVRAGDGTRPLYDWWAITPQQYPGAHYAVWTPEIARRLVQSMCPERVCRTCGEPSRRIVGEPTYARTDSTRVPPRLAQNEGERRAPGVNQFTTDLGSNTSVTARRETLGWTDCGHDDWRRGHVLDPFGGSGTTGAVATGLGRDCTLIDLDDRNLALARDRCGMFLIEDETVAS